VWDIAALRAQWVQRGSDAEAVFNYGPGEDAQKHTAHHQATGHIR
jgi:acetone carboxylase gamma subunit